MNFKNHFTMKYFSIISLSLLYFSLQAQNFYNLNTIQEIRIYFAQSNWDQLLDAERAGADGYVMADSIRINGTTLRTVGVKYKGNSSYNPTQIKNPFHIELNTYISQDYQGYTDIKLSNVKYDPSFVREALSYSILRNYMHAPLANYANLYVNNVLIGLYTNVESISKKFVNNHFGSDNHSFFDCSPPAGAGPGGTNYPNLAYLGTNPTSYYSAYDLKSDTTDWPDLINLTNTLSNNTSNIESILDVDRALWMLAFDNLFVNIDSYIGTFKQNYYLYEDDWNRFNPIVWDLNMSFGVFSSTGTIQLNGTTAKSQLTHLLHQNDAAWPLVQKLLAVPNYKRKYLAHYKTMLQENFSNGTYLTSAQNIQATIGTAVQADPNKFYSYTQFLSNLNTDVAAGMQTSPGISTLMNARNNYLSALTDFTNTQPSIINIGQSNNTPQIGSLIYITAEITNANSSSPYVGHRTSSYMPFTKVPMYDDGAHGDGAASDNIYGASIPINSINTQYYIYAENNNIGRFSPARAEHEFYTITAVYPNILAGNITINELMALNTITATDETNVHEDWIELHNNTSNSLDLGGFYLTDDTSNLFKWQIPANTILAADDYLIIWCDEDQADGPFHASFKLSSTTGESVTLSNPIGLIIDQVFFGPQTADQGFARIPNGTGNFIVQSPTFDANNEQTTATQYVDLKIKLDVYPNPARDQITVALNDLKENEDVTIYNMFGQVIYQKTAELVNLISLDSFETGFYIVKYRDITKKFEVFK